MNFPKIATLRTAELFLDHLRRSQIELPFARQLQSGHGSPLGQALAWRDRVIGNRFCILPMEGWDGTDDGKPTELTRRRWRNFGLSGAKLIWGGEAVAVRADGRANPHQLLINRENLRELSALRQELLDAHRERYGRTDDLWVGLQLTHSGRFARPTSAGLAARTAYAHPILDRRFGIEPDSAVLSDDELKQLIDDFAAAAVMASEIGFDWVDIKHCHGYLGHELLSAYDRPGAFGGRFENRTRFLRDVVAAIRAQDSRLALGVRISVYDFVPFEPDANGIGKPAADAPGEYRYAWGGDGTGTGVALDEPTRFLQLLESLGIDWVCTTAGSPYYCPHIQRPAMFPPSDGYLPPEDPLVGVARQLDVTRRLKAQFPDLCIVGSGYSYLQDWLPNVAQAAVADGWVDFVGLGRLVLSYPTFVDDVLSGRPLARKSICRTFSDCTTAPRNGMVSGCYPLDSYYKQLPEANRLRQLKHAASKRSLSSEASNEESR